MISPQPAPLQPLTDAAYAARGVSVWVKRDDLLHPVVSGNKYRKLKYLLAAAVDSGAPQLLTFGGAYSNHLLATAAAAQAAGLPSVGVVRGERVEPLNPTLADCERLGMRLWFVSRADYRRKEDPELLQALTERLGRAFIIPEGGGHPLAVKGVAELWEEIPQPQRFTHALCACGTGGTVAGLAAGAPATTQVVGVSVLKGHHTLSAEVAGLLSGIANVPTPSFWLDQHHGGYAKVSPELVNFVTEWPQKHGFLLDPLYTGKLFFAVHHQILSGAFSPGSCLLLLHSGGLQGIRGFNQRLKTQLPEPPAVRI